MVKKKTMKKIISLLLIVCIIIQKPSMALASSGNINGSILADSKVLAEAIEAEGIVLLKNKNNILPLVSEAKVNVFGSNTMNPRFGNSGSGSVSSDNCVGFYDALTVAGIEYNKFLYNTYSSYFSLSTSEMPVSKIDFKFHWLIRSLQSLLMLLCFLIQPILWKWVLLISMNPSKHLHLSGQLVRLE